MILLLKNYDLTRLKVVSNNKNNKNKNKKTKRTRLHLVFDVMDFVFAHEKKGGCKMKQVQYGCGLNFEAWKEIRQILLDKGLMLCINGMYFLTAQGKIVHNKISRILKIWNYVPTRYLST